MGFCGAAGACCGLEVAGALKVDGGGPDLTRLA